MEIKRLRTTSQLSIKIYDDEYRRMVYYYFCARFKGKPDGNLFLIVSKSWQYLLDWQREEIKECLRSAISKEPNVFQVSDYAVIRAFLNKLIEQEK